jgi:two-component sensor histidine kinase
MSMAYSNSFPTDPGFQPLHLIDEISHRVINEYTEAICTLAQAASGVRDDHALVALTLAATRLRGHAEAHRALQSPRTEGPMDLAEYIGQLCACLSKAPLAEHGVRLTLDADEVWLDADRCWRVGLIVAELVRNAARHGLSGAAGDIWVEIGESGGRVICSVCDDGNGAPSGHAGRGRRLVQALAAELDGSVEWCFAPSGCCARLDFPNPRKAPRSNEAARCAGHLRTPRAPRRFR